MRVLPAKVGNQSNMPTWDIGGNYNSLILSHDFVGNRNNCGFPSRVTPSFSQPLLGNQRHTPSEETTMSFPVPHIVGKSKGLRCRRSLWQGYLPVICRKSKYAAGKLIFFQSLLPAYRREIQEMQQRNLQTQQFFSHLPVGNPNGHL